MKIVAEFELQNRILFAPVPVIVSSDLASFPPGTKLDNGKMILALKQGCMICINPVTPKPDAMQTTHQVIPPLQTR